jgi:hypothetical protein
LRNAVLTVAGLLCALLVLGHFHDRLGTRAAFVQENLVGRSYVSGSPER